MTELERRLSGWVRLWTVGTLGYTLVMAYTGLTEFPRYPTRFYATDYFQQLAIRMAPDTTLRLLAERPDSNDREAMRRHEIAEIDMELERRRLRDSAWATDLKVDRREFLSTHLREWLIPPLGILLVWFAGRWVVRGFRKSP